MKLREYQSNTVKAIWASLEAGRRNPCVCLPTGAGKSVVIAEFIRQAEERYPNTKVLLLSHQKELVEQDAEKLRLLGVDVSIYCAGANMKEIGTVTAASIQSIARHTELLGEVDIMMVDECHLMNDEDEGQYRMTYKDLLARQPGLCLVGFTATPFRTGHGWIVGKKELFDEHLINLARIEQLQEQGYLSPLTSKATKLGFDLKGVAKRMGDYVESDLAKRVDQKLTTEQAITETLVRADGRKSWLFFCAGVEHAEHVAEELRARGIPTGCVTGSTGKRERAQMLSDFKDGKLIAMTNANVLTTGFDAPGIDMIVMLRPTLSPVLYMQMVGRGLRISEGKKDCLILDFAGNVKRHGSVLDVDPSNEENMFNRARGKGSGVAPAKVCPDCDSILPLSARVCPDCGHRFGDELVLRLDQTSEISGTEMYALDGWRWGWSDTGFFVDLFTENGLEINVGYPRYQAWTVPVLYRIVKECLGQRTASRFYPPNRFMGELVKMFNATDVSDWFVTLRRNRKGFWNIIRFLPPYEKEAT